MLLMSLRKEGNRGDKGINWLGANSYAGGLVHGVPHSERPTLSVSAYRSRTKKEGMMQCNGTRMEDSCQPRGCGVLPFLWRSDLRQTSRNGPHHHHPHSSKEAITRDPYQFPHSLMLRF